MSLNSTPNGERIHIGIFGRRNAGKSSIMNAITNQSMSIVSDNPGTTTDPVSKAMELLPLGPVVFTDTPGFDDEGELGDLRVNRAYETLRKTDIALLVVNVTEGISDYEENFLKELKLRKVPYIVCVNKTDSCKDVEGAVNDIKHNIYIEETAPVIGVSTITKSGVEDLKYAIAEFNTEKKKKVLIADLLKKDDTVVLVVPIDESAPKGRLILPQQQVIRDVLEAGCTAVVTKETELAETLEKLKDRPRVVVTDSQAFAMVSQIVPQDVYLTSFSILMARYKGDLDWQVKGAKAIDELKTGSKVLISEGCTHHRQCGDIGTVKLPAWIRKYTGESPDITFTSGTEFPDDVSMYDLVIHCGGCMLNEQEMKYRIRKARESGVSITNYGVAIAYMNGILKRSLDLLTTGDK